jgi:hypothetical protein
VKTFLKVLGFAAVGIVAIVALMALLGFVSWVLSWAIWIAVIAAVGFVAVKLLRGGAAKTAAPAELPASEAKTEASRSLSDADAMKLFEDARRKQTESK